MLRRLWRWVTGRTWAEKVIQEHREAFPGRCPICSYHRFGLQNGYVRGPVKKHECPENRG